ncbi:MAG: hypothetical protein RL357_1192 [Pseudomonadota bacterium]|jgi:hypothetical protein
MSTVTSPQADVGRQSQEILSSLLNRVIKSARAASSVPSASVRHEHAGRQTRSLRALSRRLCALGQPVDHRVAQELAGIASWQESQRLG